MTLTTEELRECKREWQKQNPEKCREYRRRWRERNPGKQEEYQRKWQEQNPDSEETKVKKRQLVAVWYQDNKGYRKAYLHEYFKTENPKWKQKGRGDHCIMCGTNILCVLDAHHIIPGVDAVITVCANCHRMIHAGIL